MNLEKFPQVKSVQVFDFQIFNQKRLFVIANGIAPTSGWSNMRLSPYFYVKPPADGFWEFDFLADPPIGPVLEIEVPAWVTLMCAPADWVKGVRVHAAQNSVEAGKFDSKKVGKNPAAVVHPMRNVKEGHVIVREQLAMFEDSWQPIGMCGPFSAKMKKLVHKLIVTVEGPDEGTIRRCISEATAAGLIAAVVVVYATGGAALAAAISAFVQYLLSCLGASFTVRVDDESHWEEWCT